jgi:TonB family protein
MKHSFWVVSVVVLGSPCFQHSVALAQDSLHSPKIQIQTQTSEPHYRMPTVPRDTTYKYNMPMYNPEKRDEVGPNDSLEIAYQPRIVFPADPKLHGMEAKVIVKVLVGETGRVLKAEVVKSSNHLFDRYALDYAKQYRFKSRGGKKIVPQWVSLPIRFKE